jgi:hypothetical protein
MKNNTFSQFVLHLLKATFIEESAVVFEFPQDANGSSLISVYQNQLKSKNECD